MTARMDGSTMDEAFMPLRRVLEEMLALGGELRDDEMGVRSYIFEAEIESPVELDVVRGPDGELQIGSTPPLYRVDTSFRPVFHRLSFRAELTERSHGD